MSECGALWSNTDRKNFAVFRKKKPVPMPFSPPQISLEIPWEQTLTSKLKDRRLPELRHNPRCATHFSRSHPPPRHYRHKPRFTIYAVEKIPLTL